MSNLFVTRSLVLGCLAATAMSGSFAQAKDPELYFYPSQKWEVSSEKNQSCTISSEFNNGFVVQFKGTVDGLTDINVDFRDNTFEEGKTYKLKLNVPGVSEAKIDAQAAKKNLLIGSLQSQKEFSKSLIQASVMDLEIEDNAFRFYLTGLGAALNDYQQCAGITPNKKIHALALEDQKQDIIPLPNEEKDSAQSPPKEEEMESFAAAKATPEVLIKDISEEEKIEEPPPPVLETAPEPEPEVTTKINAANKNAEQTSLQQKMAKLAELDTQNLPADNKNKKTSLPEDAIKKHIEFKEQASETKQEPIKQQLAEEPPVKAPPKIEKIKSPEPKIKREPKITAEADFTKYDAKNAKPLPPLEKVKDIPPSQAYPVDDFKDMRNKIKDLESQIMRLKAENKNLDDDLKNTLKDARDERLSVSSDNWNLERATMKYNESERQVERLGRQLQTQKTQCDIEKHELEGMLFDPQVTNQQQLAKLSSLEAELEQTKADILMQKRSYEERIKLLEERLGNR